MTDVLARGLAVELVPRSGRPLATRILSAAPIRGGVRVTLADVHDRNAAEALVGATVNVQRSQLGELAEGEYLDVDLIGLEVVGDDGKMLGRLVEVISTGANDVYVARAESGAEVLIPAVAHAVLDVDLKAGRLTVASDALEYGAAPVEGPADPIDSEGSGSE